MPSSRERLAMVVINHFRSGINISLATFSGCVERMQHDRKKYGDLCDLGDLGLGAPLWYSSSSLGFNAWVINVQHHVFRTYLN